MVCVRCGQPTGDPAVDDYLDDYCPDCLALIEDEDDEHEEDEDAYDPAEEREP